VSVSSDGSLIGVNSQFEQSRLYELVVTASDGGGSFAKSFRVATGSDVADTINLGGVTTDDLAFAGDGNDTVFAGAGNDTVYGQKGNDQIHGGSGNDVLWGMGGNKTIMFDTALDPATNIDRIMDFDDAHDVIQLSTAVFTAFSGSGSLTAAQFQQIASGGGGDVGALSVGSPVRVVYDASTGGLYYDSDGGLLANAIEFAVILTGVLPATVVASNIHYAL
jgi:Ca2+-binding RTX toxin-like protein